MADPSRAEPFAQGETMMSRSGGRVGLQDIRILGSLALHPNVTPEETSGMVCHECVGDPAMRRERLLPHSITDVRGSNRTQAVRILQN